MQAIDPTAPTAFQMRVLRVLRAIGPCSLADLCQHCDRPSEAVRLAVWILRDGGFVRRGSDGLYDVSTAARLALNSLGATTSRHDTWLDRLQRTLRGILSG